MTTIAAIHTPGKGSLIAADTMISTGSYKRLMRPNESKLVCVNGWAIGLAGSLRALDILRLHAEDLFHDLSDVRQLPGRVGGLFEANGVSSDPPQDGGPECFNQSMLAASPDGVWIIGSNLAVISAQDHELMAIGSGGDYAIGHGDATTGNPVKRLVGAIECAARFDSYTGGALTMINLPFGKRATWLALPVTTA